MCYLDGEVVVCSQHAGDDVQLRIFGDEFYSRRECSQGYTVVYDTTRRGYCYATLAAGRLVSSGVPLGKPVPRGLPRHLKEDPATRNEKFERRYNALRPREELSGSSASRTLGAEDGLLEGRKLSHGTVHGLVILVEFADVTMSITADDVDAMYNGDDYEVNGNFCSVKEYYGIVSSGAMTFTNRVLGPVQLPRRRSHYIGTLLVEEALEAAIDQFDLDLSDFDSRDEGIVDALTFMYAGDSQYDGELWPHNSVRRLQFGSMRTHYYMLTGAGSSRVDLRIGTACHEMGHMLCRFPDMYDYGKRDGDHEKSQGIGRYCLMGSGNHLDRRRTPSAVCSYLRELAGWAESVTINGAGATEAVHGDYATALKYELDAPNEYFLVENRSRIDLDSHLPADGLAIYHCDRLGSNEWQNGTRTRHYQCALLQADGTRDLENNTNPGDDGDLYSDVVGVAASHDTQPHTRAWNDAESGLIVSDIGSAGDIIAFRVGSTRDARTVDEQSHPNLLIPDDAPEGVESGIEIATAGTVTALEVEVEIIHTWVGDLEIILEAPNGALAILRDNKGRDDRDIHDTYRSADLPALAALNDSALAGTWKLRVIDQASRDIGRLIAWRLRADYDAAAGTLTGESAPELKIPDNEFGGVSDAIGIAGEGVVRELEVVVDVEHTYIGDLELDLVAPSGLSVRLHDNEGRDRHNLKRTYDFESLPSLRGMVGQTTDGDWTLRIRDMARWDVGVLKNWSIEIGR